MSGSLQYLLERVLFNHRIMPYRHRRAVAYSWPETSILYRSKKQWWLRCISRDRYSSMATNSIYDCTSSSPVWNRWGMEISQPHIRHTAFTLSCFRTYVRTIGCTYFTMVSYVCVRKNMWNPRNRYDVAHAVYSDIASLYEDFLLYVLELVDGLHASHELRSE